MPSTGSSPGLNRTDRQVLAAWLARVDRSRIDIAADLTRRHWNVADARAIIGIFEPGRNDASWLAVAGPGGWSLIDCTSGRASSACASLEDALALIPA